jgi:CHAD domain-containing protein
VQSPRKWRQPILPERPTAGVAFVALTGAALDQIDANAPGAAAGRDPEFLHQLRVGVRRLRSALRAFRKLLRRRQADLIEEPWRRAMPVLGEARDWDVFLAALPAGPLKEAAGARRDEAQRRVRGLLRSGSFDGARRETHARIQRGLWRRSADPSEPLATFARRALRKLHEGLLESAEDIDWRDARRRHRVRIRVKRLRYACDFFAAEFAARRTKPYLDALRALQDILGDMNDIEVQRGLLRRLAPRRSPLGAVREEAVVRASLAAREHELIAALEPAWRRFESGRRFWEQARQAVPGPG